MGRIFEAGLVASATVGMGIVGHESAHLIDIPRAHTVYGAIAESNMQGMVDVLQKCTTFGGAVI